ncbi:hypothetical protein GCM10009836_47290 [Pseudonocardia ailaonensis]|uniref:Rod shape-determining protein MreD n=1 Tax=Pseudonocardia ailaonensis TaxID=367279 RepID=A0ABN2NBG6_9PSEU
MTISIGTRLRTVAPSALLAVAAAAVVVVAADVRVPLQLPGHRGLLWLTALVATALIARRPGPATAAGLLAAGTVAVVGIGNGGPLGAVPYVLAALLLDLALGAGVIRRRPVLLALLAAPIHLVALVVPIARSARVGVGLSGSLPGLGPVALSHLGFGLVAGLAGWGIARVVRAARG